MLAIGVFTKITAYILRVVVDEGGSLYVGVEQVVHRVLLGQLAVHGNQRSFQDHVGVAEVGDNLVDAVVGGAGNREAASKHACGRGGRAGVRLTSPPAHPRRCPLCRCPLCRMQTPERVGVILREHVYSPLYGTRRKPKHAFLVFVTNSQYFTIFF